MSEILLQFSGPLTLAQAMTELARQEQQLEAARRQHQGADLAQFSVVADLSGLTDIDTAALAVLLQLDRRVRQWLSRPLRLRGASHNLMSLARLSSLLPALDWEDGVPQ
jgi:ABC-type transporter Mla MlaB component